MAFLNYPFPDSFHTLFIAALFRNDPSIEINLERKQRSSADEFAKTDYIFDYVDGRFVQVKPTFVPK